MSLQHAESMFANQRIALIDPEKWPDKNDSYFIDLYRKHAEVEKVFVACFTQRKERYHHWKSFAAGADSIAVEFYKRNLEAEIRTPGIISGDVDYLPLRRLQSSDKLIATDLPFLKRYGYIDEQEWRILSHSNDRLAESIYLPLSIDSIKRVVITPFATVEQRQDIQRKLRAIAGLAKLRVVRSQLTGSREWMAAGDRIFARLERKIAYSSKS